jgi:plasmid stabilization system protein ParE
LELLELTEEAVFDIDATWAFLQAKAGVEMADAIVTEFFKTFRALSDAPHIGHRRTDLTSRRVLFYNVFSHLIVYGPASKPLRVFGVLHGKRDALRILRPRPRVLPPSKPQ